jgi:fucose 4-O-acetylase-like acetyltransferase
VPLCVLTSGIVFHVGQKEFRNFLKVKIQTLMIPYYSFATVSIVIYALLGSKMEKTVGGGVRRLSFAERNRYALC